MIHLGWISRDLTVRLFVLFWLSINLVRTLPNALCPALTAPLQAAQIAVATIGLTYNVDPAETMAVTAPGMVYIPDMSVLRPMAYSENTNPGLGLLRYTANK